MKAIFESLSRGFLRIALLAFAGALLVAASNLIPLLLGPTGAPLAYGFGLCLLGLAVGDAALRVLQPTVDTQLASQHAITNHNIGAGLVYLGRSILAAVVLMLIVTAPRAAEPPGAALALLPVLKAEQLRWWPDHPLPSTLGAQIEQETCYSLKHHKCWSPQARLKTSREEGYGLGQITRTWDKLGAKRFDSLAEMRAQFPDALAGWSWDSPSLSDPRMQMRGMILMDLRNYRALADVHETSDRLAMALAAYNGGLGGVRSDQKVCAGTLGCDPARWWGHVEHTSLKDKTAVPGYGKPFFAINREYPVNIMFVRRPRYVALDA